MKKFFLFAVMSFALVGSTAMTQKAVAQDVHKVAPAMYKVLSDTLGIRMLEAVYQPGQGSAMHSHPDFLIYVLEGGKVEVTGANGTKRVVDFIKGMGLTLPADTHTAKNVGTTLVRLVVIEVNRARQ